MIASVQRAPQITQELAARIDAELYGIEGLAEPLPSERDQNFLINSADKGRFVLKLANSEETLEFLDLQNQMIQFLSARQVDLEFPRIMPAKTGESIARTRDENGRKHFVRLLTWLDGDCFAEVQLHGRKLLASLGRVLAQMDASLVEFDHPAAHRLFH